MVEALVTLFGCLAWRTRKKTPLRRRDAGWYTIRWQSLYRVKTMKKEERKGGKNREKKEPKVRTGVKRNTSNKREVERVSCSSERRVPFRVRVGYGPRSYRSVGRLTRASRTTRRSSGCEGCATETATHA